jgi:hypothetical protein
MHCDIVGHMHVARKVQGFWRTAAALSRSRALRRRRHKAQRQAQQALVQRVRKFGLVHERAPAGGRSVKGAHRRHGPAAARARRRLAVVAAVEQQHLGHAAPRGKGLADAAQREARADGRVERADAVDDRSRAMQVREHLHAAFLV